jgi:sigma-B regulation protein RsbU (phosphoserine phosphatase)
MTQNEPISTDLSIGRTVSPHAALLQSIAVAVVAFIALAGMSYYVYHHSKASLIDEIRAGLERTARIAAQSVDSAQHRTFTQPEQKPSPEYQAAIRPLRQMMAADPEIAFAYSAVLIDGAVHFVLDATPAPQPGAEDESVQIMQVYTTPPPDLLIALKEQRTVVSKAPYTDKWGTFISAYEPFSDAAGAFVGVVGVDLTTKNYQARVRPIQRSTLVAILLSAGIALLLGLATWVQRRTDRSVHEQAQQLKIVNALLNVSRALGSNVGINNILPIIVSKTSEVMNVERTSLFLYDRQQHTLRSRVLEGMDEDEGLSFSDTRGVVGRVARTGVAANVLTPQLDPDFDTGFDRQSGFHTRNMLVVPILDSKNNVMAVLQALNRRASGGFAKDDVLLMNALVAQAQVALEREQLNRSVQDKRKLEESLKFAQTIQMSMLPTNFPAPGATSVDLHALLVPAKVVGGDFYDFIDLGNDRLGLVVADVSGKGVPAALTMAKAMTLVRAFALVGTPPAETLRQANEELARDNASAMFVTVFFAILDLRSGAMVYSNGGHNAPLRVSAGAVTEILGSESVPLGSMPKMEYYEAQMQLSPGDLLYLFTDGINEAMSPSLEEYGDARLRDLVLGIATQSVEQITARTLIAVREHANGAEQSDDITVLALRWRG